MLVLQAGSLMRTSTRTAVFRYVLFVLCVWPVKTWAGAISEVVFVMDSSGSLGPDGWEDEKAFVIDLINGAFSNVADTSIGIVTFSSASFTEWTFTNSQDRAIISAHVGALAWQNGTTATRLGINDAIDVFHTSDIDLGAPSDGINGIVLITDGNPFSNSLYNPCLVGHANPARNEAAAETRGALADLDANVKIVGIGTDWNPEIIDCIVADPLADIVDIYDVSANFFADFTSAPAAIPSPGGAAVFAFGLAGLAFAARPRKSRVPQR